MLDFTAGIQNFIQNHAVAFSAGILIFAYIFFIKGFARSPIIFEIIFSLNSFLIIKNNIEEAPSMVLSATLPTKPSQTTISQ